jgi:hypothetical protein
MPLCYAPGAVQRHSNVILVRAYYKDNAHIQEALCKGFLPGCMITCRQSPAWADRL